MKNITLLLFILTVTLVSPDLLAKPKILASIKPLALIAQELVGDLAEVEILLTSNADPHHYSLKVSDRRKLQAADLIIWMGPEFERFLSKPLSSLDQTKVLVLANQTAVENKEENSPNQDYHQWLSPKNAMAMSKAIAERLVDNHPDLQSRIIESLAKQEASLQQLHQELVIALFPYQNYSFLGDHAAYQSLADAYMLNQVAWVIKHAEIAPSAQHLSELSELVKQQKPECLLVEAGQQSTALTRWAERWDLQTVTIDILGIDKEIGSYRALMESLMGSLLTCLQGA